MKRKQATRYFLISKPTIVAEGISLYSVIHEADFSEKIIKQYFNDVEKKLQDKLASLIAQGVTEKEVARIQHLVKELVHITELHTEYKEDARRLKTWKQK